MDNLSLNLLGWMEPGNKNKVKRNGAGLTACKRVRVKDKERIKVKNNVKFRVKNKVLNK